MLKKWLGFEHHQYLLAHPLTFSPAYGPATNCLVQNVSIIISFIFDTVVGAAKIVVISTLRNMLKL